MRSVLIAVLVLTSCSCRTDFRLTTDFKEIPVIYGLLDVQDSVHYVRIQRAYLDADGNAFHWSQVPDSIYYADVLDVSIEELGTGIVFNLERVSGDTLRLPKETGTFAHVPNILYQLSASLDPAEQYRLTVHNTQKDMWSSAETWLVNDFFSLLPGHGYVINWSGAEGEKVAFSWHNALNANIYELIMRFNYLEHQAGESDSVKSITWSVFGNYYTAAQPGVGLEVTWSTRAFFQRIGSTIASQAATSREALKVDFYLYAGGIELGNYINNQQASSGITETVVTPGYTNIAHGKGIFSSRFLKVVQDIPLGATALDSLVGGQYTRHLGFTK